MSSNGTRHMTVFQQNKKIDFPYREKLMLRKNPSVCLYWGRGYTPVNYNRNNSNYPCYVAYLGKSYFPCAPTRRNRTWGSFAFTLIWENIILQHIEVWVESECGIKVAYVNFSIALAFYVICVSSFPRVDSHCKYYWSNASLECHRYHR